MSQNFVKRIITSIFLLSLLFFINFSNNYIFIFSILTLGIIVCAEANNLFSKFLNIKQIKKSFSFKKLNFKFFFLNILTFCYVFFIFCNFSYELYINAGPIFFLYIISICFFYWYRRLRSRQNYRGQKIIQN